jgi:hypothetical protein
MTQGNGTGLVLANQAMSSSGGSFTYTFSNASFVQGSKIGLDVLANTTAGQVNVPQGALSDATSWASFTYAASNSESPYGGTAWAIPGQVEAENFDLGGQGVAYSTPSTSNQGGQYRTSDDIGIEATTDTGFGYDVGWTVAGEWLRYTVNVTATGSYTLNTRVANNGLGGTFHYLVDGVSATASQTVPNTGGWQVWTTLSTPVSLTVGQHVIQLNLDSAGPGGNVGNFNWFSVTGSTSAPVSLLPLSGSSQMTIQFANNTNGAWPNSSIYLLVIARNSSNNFCYLTPDGNLVPLVAGQNLQSLFYRMSDIQGFQVPAFMDSARLYVAMGTPLNIPVNTDINGNVGVAFPNIENPTDPSINDDFDWIEFAVVNNNIWCNTTQVDQFDIPITMQLFTGTNTSYTSVGTVGVTETRSQIFNEFEASVPPEFAGLVQAHRIVAPLHGGFRTGQPNAGYFDSYISSVWQEYTTQPFVVTVPQGTFTGYVQGTQMAFTRPNDSTVYYVQEPTSEDVWGGMGTLNSGNTIQLVLEAQICAAFHRHVMDNAANLNNPSAYYQTAPFDY